MENLIKNFKREILKAFPTLKILSYYDKDEKGYFIVLDNMKIYNSSEFTNFIFQKKLDLIMNKKITNVFVVCDPTKFIVELEGLEFNFNIGRSEIRFDNLQTPCPIETKKVFVGNYLALAA